MGDAEEWREVGDEAAGLKLEDARCAVESAVYAITVDTLFQNGDLTPNQAKQARMALNRYDRLVDDTYPPRLVMNCGPIPCLTYHTAGYGKYSTLDDN